MYSGGYPSNGNLPSEAKFSFVQASDENGVDVRIEMGTVSAGITVMHR
ncbi:hypothetical protein L917_16209 [Phytophthora nicotianae]|uniref:Uncharacterized protein n=1 Tax=Phytophthora nicotianae TaxID=4792 RepID=W2I8X2_PHYNI|nr:hypothetical protein L915_16485 [Phytophthora nicotianae]ETL30684.1 hypothetical protein L916_16386 [Phytophthora nicotianae]ETL83916.1 hypothetical protein L917_16209 [Phytophthora nicotianae]